MILFANGDNTMRRSQLVYLLVATLCLASASFAQISQGGSPVSLNTAALSAPETRSLPTVNHEAMLAEGEHKEAQ